MKNKANLNDKISGTYYGKVFAGQISAKRFSHTFNDFEYTVALENPITLYDWKKTSLLIMGKDKDAEFKGV